MVLGCPVPPAAEGRGGAASDAAGDTAGETADDRADAAPSASASVGTSVPLNGFEQAIASAISTRGARECNVRSGVRMQRAPGEVQKEPGRAGRSRRSTTCTKTSPPGPGDGGVRFY